MHRSIRVALLALITGAVLLLAGPAVADRNVLLADSPLAGVVQNDNVIRIDLEMYKVEPQGEDILVLSGKKKKKKKGGGGSGGTTVGLTCACSSGGGACSISQNGDQATCGGGSCCSWVKMAGDTLGVGSPPEIIAP